MAYSLVSSCPECGAPIWADLEDQCPNNPPQHKFSCECKFEKRNKLQKEPYIPAEPNQQVPWDIRPVPAPFTPFQPYITWTSEGTGTPPPIMRMGTNLNGNNYDEAIIE